jgi:hypothetical protein
VALQLIAIALYQEPLEIVTKGEKSGLLERKGEEQRAHRAMNESNKEDSDWSLGLRDIQEQRSGNDIATDR